MRGGVRANEVSLLMAQDVGMLVVTRVTELLGDLLSVVAAGSGWLAAQAIAGNATVTNGGTVAVVTGGEVGFAVGAVLPPGSGKGGHREEGGQEGGLGGTCHGVGRGGVRGSGGAQAARVLAAWEGRRVWGRPSSLVSVERDVGQAFVPCERGEGCGADHMHVGERKTKLGMSTKKVAHVEAENNIIICLIGDHTLI